MTGLSANEIFKCSILEDVQSNRVQSKFILMKQNGPFITMAPNREMIETFFSLLLTTGYDSKLDTFQEEQTVDEIVLGINEWIESVVDGDGRG